MRTIYGTIRETIVVEKSVVIDVTDEAGDMDVEQALRDKAYEHTIHEAHEVHGWDGVECEEVTITWNENG